MCIHIRFKLITFHTINWKYGDCLSLFDSINLIYMYILFYTHWWVKMSFIFTSSSYQVYARDALIIYYIGYGISLVALSIALWIFLYFKWVHLASNCISPVFFFLLLLSMVHWEGWNNYLFTLQYTCTVHLFPSHFTCLYLYTCIFTLFVSSISFPSSSSM